MCDLNSSSLWGQDAFVEDFFFSLKNFLAIILGFMSPHAAGVNDYFSLILH